MQTFWKFSKTEAIDVIGIQVCLKMWVIEQERTTEIGSKYKKNMRILIKSSTTNLLATRVATYSNPSPQLNTQQITLCTLN